MGKYEKDQINDIVNEMLDFTGDRVKALGQTITLELAASTPKATGLASSSWVASPGPGTIGRVPPRNATGVSRAKTEQEKSLVRLAGYKIEDGKINIGTVIPYAEKLNEGSSPQQARPGYVQRVAVKAVADANRKK